MTTSKFPLGDVIILRGLPGIGKSHLVREVLTKSLDTSFSVLSADTFFIEADGKIYNFDKEKLDEAFTWCFKRFKEEISKKTPLIIVDNTNIKLFHYWHYIDYAQRHNYRASVLTIPHNDISDRELEDRCIHGIERGTIHKMRKEFEWNMEKKG